MEVKEEISVALDWARVEEAAKLAVPEEKPDTRHTRAAKHQFFGVQIELEIETPDLREIEECDEHEGDRPPDIGKLLPFPAPDPVDDKTGGDGDQDERSLGHTGATGQQRSGHEVPAGPGPRSLVKMINRADDEPRQIGLGADVIVRDDQVCGRNIDEGGQLRNQFTINRKTQLPGIPG